MTPSFSYVLLLLSFFPFRLAAAENPKLRVLPPEIAEAFCRGQFDLKALWAAKMFDVQVEGRRLQSQGHQTEISEIVLERRSRALAQELNFHGFSFGTCAPSAQGGGWVAAFPSATPLEISGTAVRVSERTGCESHLTCAWVSENRGTSKRLPDLNGLDGDSIFELPKDQTGFFTLECPSKNGIAQEFYFGPIGVPLSKFPYGEKLETAAGSDIGRVLDWINVIRLEHGLHAVSLDTAQERNIPADILNLRRTISSHGVLTDGARDLARSGRVQHSAKMLTFWKNKLAANHIQLIGENRSRGSTLSEAGFLLWASPRHRDLLLNERANILGIDIVKSRDGVFLGVLAGLAVDPKTNENSLGGPLAKSELTPETKSKLKPKKN